MTRSVTSNDQVVSSVRSIPRNVRAFTNAEVNPANAVVESSGGAITDDNGQTCLVIDPRFVYLAVALSAFGAYGYIRDTLRGDTAPNRVTWSLWGSRESSLSASRYNSTWDSRR